VFVRNSPSLGTGLQTNESKSKYITINRNITNLEQDQTTVGEVFERAKIYRY